MYKFIFLVGFCQNNAITAPLTYTSSMQITRSTLLRHRYTVSPCTCYSSC